MTCTRLSSRGFSGIICTTPDFKPGDQAPEGYLAWHEWAEVQHKAGLRPKECGRSTNAASSNAANATAAGPNYTKEIST